MIRVLLALAIVLALPAAAQPADPWKVTLGVTTIAAPSYPGSDELRVLPVPYWDVEYRDRFFSKGLDFAGVWLTNGPHWRTGGALTWEFDSRDERDSASFTGLGDVENTLRAKLFATYSRSLFNVSVDAAHDVLGRDQGLVASANASMAIPFYQPWFFAFGPGVTWIDEENATSFFGVDGPQSAASGYPVFEAGAGLRNVELSAVASRRLGDRWTGSLVVVHRRLQGDAADSPLTPKDSENAFIVTFARRIR